MILPITEGAKIALLHSMCCQIIHPRKGIMAIIEPGNAVYGGTPVLAQCSFSRKEAP
jgi:hypothetical protein